jgi:hypothetical protein|tara:strand:+ start:16242 stop:16754 length:513 start_codon:yes stop_codon:yes gene_type:complete
MSQVQQWINDLALLPDLTPAIQRWQPFLHSCTASVFSREQLPEALKALGAVSGWLTETSRVTELESQPVELQSLPLAGEFFNSAQQHTNHWQLTQLPRGQWQLTHHQLQACPAEQANCLAQPVTHLHAHKDNTQLSYWKLWSTSEQDAAPSARIALLMAIESTPSKEHQA